MLSLLLRVPVTDLLEEALEVLVDGVDLAFLGGALALSSLLEDVVHGVFQVDDGLVHAAVRGALIVVNV